MKPTETQRPAGTAEAVGVRRDRRGLVVGTGVAGVAAVAAHALLRSGVETPVAAAATKAAADGAGYRATPHVLRYYETTKA
jgi:hypothetical protein